MSGWDNPHTARRYDAYAKQFPAYQNTSQDLTKLAALKTGMHVIDLACGTGITSEAVLVHLGQSGHLYAIDASTAMLAVAQQNISSSNVSFHHEAAERLDKAVSGKVDRIVCNSAFWQFDMKKTLVAMKSVLKENGRFAFNIPDSFSPVCKGQQAESVNLRVLMRQIAQDSYGLTFEAAPPVEAAQRFDRENISRLLQKSGFQFLKHETIAYQESASAAKEFLTIPIMTERTLPGLDYPTRLEILDKAYRQLDDKVQYKGSWDFYLVQPDG